ncbi:uncharacterized protein METZ01_LOCUS129889, partial [marine metagenome]
MGCYIEIFVNHHMVKPIFIFHFLLESLEA